MKLLRISNIPAIKKLNAIIETQVSAMPSLVLGINFTVLNIKYQYNYLV